MRSCSANILFATTLRKELNRLSLIFITGGARSGKSAYAVELAKRHGGRTAFIATAVAGDDEMEQRIQLHQASRPPAWTTVEEPIKVAEAISGVAVNHQSIIVDCLTLLVSNLIFATPQEPVNPEHEQSILKAIKQIAETAKNTASTVIVISNELGMGIVPDNALARYFRDVCGRANQLLAAAADEVYVCFSGIPVRIK